MKNLPLPIPKQESFADLVSIVRNLRVHCPWDREQSHDSISPHLIEEAYEVAEAIEEKNDSAFRAELGDILLHVVMHSVMAEERGAFGLAEVVSGLSGKLVNRHPHVYGETSTTSSSEVAKNWEEQKMHEGRESIFDGMPKALPALQRAERVQSKGSKVGFDWATVAPVWDKIEEELLEFRSALESEGIVRQEAEFGDLLFALVNLSRFFNIKAESALQKSTNRFISRFQHMEGQARRNSRMRMSEMTLEELEVLWVEAKNAESSEH